MRNNLCKSSACRWLCFFSSAALVETINYCLCKVNEEVAFPPAPLAADFGTKWMGKRTRTKSNQKRRKKRWKHGEREIGKWVTNNVVFSRQRADKKRNVIDLGACVCVGAKCQLKREERNTLKNRNGNWTTPSGWQLIFWGGSEGSKKVLNQRNK